MYIDYVTHNKEVAIMVTKYCGIDFKNLDGALTLDPSFIGNNDSGWEIKGEIKEDYYEWVNDFEAFHSDFGRVWGDFESEVYADSEEGFAHFYEHHKPEAWDYYDI
jgi:hypothetical protein